MTEGPTGAPATSSREVDTEFDARAKNAAHAPIRGRIGRRTILLATAQDWNRAGVRRQEARRDASLETCERPSAGPGGQLEGRPKPGSTRCRAWRAFTWNRLARVALSHAKPVGVRTSVESDAADSRDLVGGEASPHAAPSEPKPGATRSLVRG